MKSAAFRLLGMALLTTALSACDNDTSEQTSNTSVGEISAIAVTGAQETAAKPLTPLIQDSATPSSPTPTPATPTPESIEPTDVAQPPVQESVTPVIAEATPTKEPAEPVQAEPAPTQEPAKPVQTEPTPAQEPAKPAQADPTPAQEPAEPVQVEAKPQPEPEAPVQAEPKPVPEPAAPIQAEPKPVPEPEMPVQVEPTPVTEPEMPVLTEPTPIPEPAVPIQAQVDIECGVDAQKLWAYESMRDYYLFYDKVPDVDLQDYESSRQVVQRLRFRERDPYSNISDTQASKLETIAGREFRLGYRWARDPAGQPRIQAVTRNSPMDLAGITRGDIILRVDGLDWSDEKLDEGFYERTLGTPDTPSTATWQFQKGDTGQIVTVDITGAEYNIVSVSRTRVIANPKWPERIGYLVFERFLATSEAELNESFKGFQKQDITDLVLDLRYNRGGLIRIAEQLASLIAGNNLSGQLLYEYRHNDKNVSNDEDLYFQNTEFGLGLSRLIVLTSPATASASELVIAGLQPYINVVTIGEDTEGKPFISTPDDRCGERLNLMKAEGFNAANVSVDGGLQATCYAADDLSRDFGLNDGSFEGLFLAGVDYIREGVCATKPMISASRSSLDVAQPLFPTPEQRQELSSIGRVSMD